jgi:hypothetical protein
MIFGISLVNDKRRRPMRMADDEFKEDRRG